MNSLAQHLNIRNPKDWGKVHVKHVIEYGGSTLIAKHNGSLFSTLQSVYSGI